MAVTALKLKVMPENPETDLGKVRAEAEKKLEDAGAQNISFEEQEIAFGLKALIITMAWPEEKDTDIAENKAREIKGVSSVEIIDYRRAFG